jgi:hypothetical protein
MSGLDVSVGLDASDFYRRLNDVERKQMPQATVWALNDTAAEILDHVQDHMEVVFDRPTRFTKNAFMVWRAKKSTLEAKVQERPSVGSRHYLKVQEAGGVRPKTGMEKMLAGEGVMSALVPAAGARLDRSGNWSRSQMRQAIGGVTGKGQPARGAFFTSSKGGRLSPGIWKRTGKGKREKLTKVAHFLDYMPRYTERLEFMDGAEEVFDRRFATHFDAAFRKAMQTAR